MTSQTPPPAHDLVKTLDLLATAPGLTTGSNRALPLAPAAIAIPARTGSALSDRPDNAA